MLSLSHSILKEAHRLISLCVGKKNPVFEFSIFVSAPFSFYPFLFIFFVLRDKIAITSFFGCVRPSDLSTWIYREKHDRDCDIEVIT